MANWMNTLSLSCYGYLMSSRVWDESVGGFHSEASKKEMIVKSV